MKLRFTFRSDFYELPPALDIFEFTRAFYLEFTKNPNDTFKAVEKNVFVMGQLQNGLYFSFVDNPMNLFTKFQGKARADNLKLEMSWPIPGMIRVEITNIENTLPFRVPNNLSTA